MIYSCDSNKPTCNCYDKIQGLKEGLLTIAQFEYLACVKTLCLRAYVRTCVRACVCACGHRWAGFSVRSKSLAKMSLPNDLSKCFECLQVHCIRI